MPYTELAQGSAERTPHPYNSIDAPSPFRLVVKILALDTSTEHCSVALWCDGEVVADEAHAGQRHSELLLPMVDRLLAQAQTTLRGLDAIAYGEGPGSFTGLRIACGVAQGLAFGAGLPVVGIGTLLALAEASGAENVACGLDARMKEIYFAAYQRADGAWHCRVAPMLCSPGAAPNLPLADWVGCGNAFPAYPDALAHALGPHCRRVSPILVPHAREIAVLAADEVKQGRARPAEQALPVYIRDKVALTVEEQR